MGPSATSGHRGIESCLLFVSKSWEFNLQVSDVERLLVNVCSVRPSSQAGHGGQVTAVTSHRLNDEHAPLGSAGRLLDAVTCLAQSVKAHNVNTLNTRVISPVQSHVTILKRAKPAMMSGHMLLKKIKEQLSRPACLVTICTESLHAVLLTMQTHSGRVLPPAVTLRSCIRRKEHIKMSTTCFTCCVKVTLSAMGNFSFRVQWTDKTLLDG